MLPSKRNHLGQRSLSHFGKHAYSTFGNLEAGHSQNYPAGGFTPKRRRGGLNTCRAILWCLFVPWILFICFYAIVLFKLHYDYDGLVASILVGLGILIIFMIALATMRELMTPDGFPHGLHGPADRCYMVLPFLKTVGESGWLTFLLLTSALAGISGIILGDINYWTNMVPYYELQTLNSYDDVNPSTFQGQQMMDSGRVHFLNETYLDLTKSYQFQDMDTYCVAPISIGTPTLKTYDFWAVGLNCCGFNVSKQFEYKCGPYTSKTAKQGLRLMMEHQRDYFKLAVQQAEAQHKITANHPLLFYWTEDAKKDEKSYWEYGNSFFLTGILLSLCWQIFAILVNIVIVHTCGIPEI